MHSLEDPEVRDRLGVVATWALIVLVFLPIGASGLAIVGFWSGNTELAKASAGVAMFSFPLALSVLALVALVAGGLGLAKTFTKHSYRHP